VFDTGGPGKGPRFAEDLVLDEADVGAYLGSPVTQGYAQGFLDRWVRRGVAEYVDARTPISRPEPDGQVSSEGSRSDVSDDEKKQDEAPDLSGLTRAELEALAADRGIDVAAARNKGEIIAALTADA
jgi:hypothetical protein